jgi:hypothetical protein
VNNKKWLKWSKLVSTLLFNNTYCLPVLTVDTKCPNQVLYVWLVNLHTICPKYGMETCFVQMMIFVDICPPWSMVELQTRLEEWISTNAINGVSLFHLSYLITLMVYFCSEWKTNVEIKYFIFDWSIYRLFVINRVSKRYSLHIMIF